MTIVKSYFFCETWSKKECWNIGVEFWTPAPQTMKDVAAKSNCTVGILWKTIDFETPSLWPFSRTPVKCYYKHLSYYQCTITVFRHSQTETYLVESPNLQYTQIYCISHFNPTGIALTAFYARKEKSFILFIDELIVQERKKTLFMYVYERRKVCNQSHVYYWINWNINEWEWCTIVRDKYILFYVFGKKTNEKGRECNSNERATYMRYPMPIKCRIKLSFYYLAW
jgi:hypothetical protein